MYFQVCSQRQLCTDCGSIVEKYKGETLAKHECGLHYCKLCKKKMPKDHQCYMQPKDAPEVNENHHFIFFDFESRLGAENQHVPNLCVVNKVCAKCVETSIQDPSPCGCGRKQIIFKGSTTLEEFGTWLFNEEKNGKSIAIAHNGKSYDFQLLMDFLHGHCIKPTITEAGQKIMRLQANGVVLIDSLNFIGTALSNLPKMFALEEAAKGFFPHLFSTAGNQDFEGPLPPMHHYDPDSMSTSRRAEFLQWYEVNKGKQFHFQKELLKYCQSDVDILQRACGQFRRMFVELTGSDPFTSVTIAGK